ncbi:hypothetical protein [Litorisediminicola beolgyonensis]|uniref:DUF4142 domain-containing protein n=1 Tax=Litorisediminicola beolgyonensis TaxID=1173614 RepID=A0ABW3ZNK4_9RHOB
MKLKTIASLAAAVALLAEGAVAADYSDPTWPCIQRKVERLSIGLMWPHAVEEAPDLAADLARDIDALADTLVLRRISLEEAEARVAEFAESHETTDQVMSQVFSRVFDQIAQRRTRIMEGIADFSLGQIALAERIDAARVEMDTVMEAAEPDYDRADALEEQIDWDERIYTDRQKSLTYVCETPVLLEKRLYAIAQMLQGKIEG